MPSPEDYAEDAARFTALLALTQDLERDEAPVVAGVIRRAQGRVTLAEVRRVLETGEKRLGPGEVWGALRELLLPGQTGEEIGGALAGAATRTVEVTGPAHATTTARLTGVELDFDDIARGARAWAAGEGSALIADMTATSPGLLRAQLNLVLSEPMELEDAARLIRGSLGLSERQATALFNANQDWLRQQAAGKLSATSRRALLAEYRERLIDSRAEELVRDVIARASNTGQRLAWRETVGLAPELGTSYERRAVGILSDGKICEFCYERHDWRAPIDGTYPDGSDGPPWGHPRCRCLEELVEVGTSGAGKPPFVVPSDGGSLRPLA
ncbi:MAG: hypothetical protein GY719_25835 [bacterium]|nr:hypothetical protein [bacterium]